MMGRALVDCSVRGFTMLASSSRTGAHSVARFETGRVPDAKRLEFWNRVNTETFSKISVDPLGQDLRGILELRERGQLKLARVHSSPVSLRGGRSDTAGHAGGGLLLHLQEVGCTLNSQLNRSNLLRVGDITLCDAARPYSFECREPVEITVIKIPQNLIAQRFQSIDQFISVHVDGARGVGAILASIIRNFWIHCDELEADAGDALINTLLDLIPLIPQGGNENSLPSSAQKLCHEMKTHVVSRLADPDLSVHSLALEFGVSPRHVHRIFSEFTTTPSIFILDSRLSLAAARLRDPKSDASITQIAFDSGFNDCTSFSRSFRRKYGVTPRAFRLERRTV
jgi:AraC-like DNA-binding protein